MRLFSKSPCLRTFVVGVLAAMMARNVFPNELHDRAWQGNARTNAHKDVVCKICSAPAAPFANAAVLGSHRVEYFICSSCGFVQTEDPYWLEEAYSHAVSRIDIGAVTRNLMLAPVAEAVIRTFFDPRATFLDYGGGPGLLVRMLRDRGLDFRWHDRHDINLFARGFEGQLDRHYEVVTAFEVFEHFAAPIEEFQRIFRVADSVLFTTELLPPDRPKPGEWWYYALEGGQHISIYTREALQRIADRFGCNLYSSRAFHLLTPRALSPALFRIVTRTRVARFLRWMAKGKSLGQADREQICELIRTGR